MNNKSTRFILVLASILIAAKFLYTFSMLSYSRSIVNARPSKVIKEYDPCLNVTVGTNTYCKNGTLLHLDKMNATEKVNFYDEMFFGIKDPPAYKKTFAKASTEVRLEVVLIETTLTLSPRLKHSLYNIAHIYGGKNNVSFTIIANAVNEPLITELVEKEQFKNVRQFYIGNPMDIEGYNQMLCSMWFWNLFRSPFVLITHTDSIIFRPLDEWMFNYGLIGAPWGHGWFPYLKIPVGNGGYTLRDVGLMREILEKIQRNPGDINEDLWWSGKVENEHKLPTAEQALHFAFELVVTPNIIPTGAHKIYAYSLFGLGDAFRLIAKFHKSEMENSEIQ